MNQIDDAILSAWLDNELDAQQQADVDAALAGSAELRARLEKLRQANVAARDWFTQTDDEPLPSGLEQLILTAPLSQAQSNVVPLRRRLPLPAWGLAASLLLGSVLWWQMPSPQNDVIAGFADSARTGDILEGDGWRAEIVMSFTDADGQKCRELRRHTAQGSSTLIACGAPGHWTWQTSADTDSYQTASGPADAQRQIMSAADEQRWLEHQ